jgi:hypothetical protein
VDNDVLDSRPLENGGANIKMPVHLEDGKYICGWEIEKN